MKIGNKNSFIFRLNDNKNIEKFEHAGEEPTEIIHADWLLPCFCDDLWIHEDCNKNLNNSSNIGWCYKTPNGIVFDSIEATTFMTGEDYSFQVEDLEVF